MSQLKAPVQTAHQALGRIWNKLMARNLASLFKHSTMAFVFLICGGGSTTLAQQSSSRDERSVSGSGWYRTNIGQVVVNLEFFCKKLTLGKPCHIKIGSIEITVDGSTENGYQGYSGTFSSNIPISAARIFSYYPPKILVDSSGLVRVLAEGSRPTWLGNGWVSLSRPLKKKIGVEQSMTTISDLTLDAGMIDLGEDLKVASLTFSNLLRYNLERAEEFQANIKLSDRKHVERIKLAMKAALAMIEDDKGNVKVPVTSVHLQEQMRLIMVLATVLNDLLVEYGDIESIRLQVQALSSLAAQIRKAYDWKNAFAGSASKGMAVLAELVELELKIISSEDALSESNEIYNKLRMSNFQIGAMVQSSSGGDIRAIVPTREFAKIWNEDAWQFRLSALLNVKDAAKAETILKSLKLLHVGTEQMSALTDVQFILPRDVEAKFKK